MDNGASSYHRYLDGDDNGIVDIVRDYKDGLILYLNQYVSNIYIAEELAEDTFFRIMVKKPKYVQKHSFKAWLYTIGRNIAIDYIRKNSKILSLQEYNTEHLSRDAESLELAYIKEERKMTVHKALAKLKLDYRQALYLIFFEDFTNQQVARVLHKTKHQTETLIYRAKLALKKELEKEGFSYERL